jgi:hypothetical protein
MRALLLIIVTLGGCAAQKPIINCPPVPEVGAQETLLHYTTTVVIQYNECAASAQRAVDGWPKHRFFWSGQ